MNEPVNLPIHAFAAGPFEVSGYGGYRQVHQPSGGKLFAFESEGNHLLTCDGSTSVIYGVSKFFYSSCFNVDPTKSGHSACSQSVPRFDDDYLLVTKAWGKGDSQIFIAGRNVLIGLDQGWANFLAGGPH